MVNEKQQLMNPSCNEVPSLLLFLLEEVGAIVGVSPAPPGFAVAVPEEGPLNEAAEGLYRKTQEVNTAFWAVSNATWPYFCARASM
jgi:hypothetical protein